MRNKFGRFMVLGLAMVAAMVLTTPQAHALGGFGSSDEECTTGPIGEQCVQGAGEWVSVVCSSGGCQLEFECVATATGGTAASTSVDYCTAIGQHSDDVKYDAPAPVAMSANVAATGLVKLSASVEPYIVCFGVSAVFNVGGSVESEGCTTFNV